MTRTFKQQKIEKDPLEVLKKQHICICCGCRVYKDNWKLYRSSGICLQCRRLKNVLL